MYEIMAENYNWQVRRIKPGDKTGLDCHALKKDLRFSVIKKQAPFASVGKAKGERSKLIIADKQGDVVTFGDNTLYVEIPLQFLKVTKPQHTAADVAPYRIKLGAVNQRVTLHYSIDNILYLNQRKAFPDVFGFVRQQHIGDDDIVIVSAER